jgi:two-component system cell cycle sensor histidine kinase/response regulator CckA
MKENSDPKGADQELRRLKEFNESIVQNMVEGIAVQDAQGCFTFLNPAAGSLLGYAPEELVGQHWTVVVPLDQQPVVQRADRRRLQGEADRYPLELRRRDGSRVRVLISASPRFDPDSGQFAGTLAVFTDISERAQVEERLTRHAQEMAALYETALDINSQPDLSTLLQAIVERASKLVGARMGGLYLMQPGGEELELVVSYNLPRDYTGTRLHLGEGLSGRVAQTGKPMMVGEYHLWEGRTPIYEASHLCRVLGVPLRVGNRIIGVINVTDDRKTELFDEEEIRLVSLFADQAAIAVENRRLLESEARRRREAETVQMATQALSATLDLQRVFELILTELRKVVPYDSASVQQLKGHEMELIGGYGFPNLDELLGARFDLTRADNPNQVVVRLRAPFILEDAPAFYREFKRKPHAQAGIRSWLGVPLLFGDRLIGMIALDKREPGFYNQDHAQLAMGFAAQAAIAIENARLFEAEREQRELTEALQQATVAVSSTLELEQVLDKILEQVSRVVPDDSANIMLIEDGRAQVVRWRGYDQPGDVEYLRSIAFPVAETPNLRQMQETGEAVVIADTTNYSGWLHEATRVQSYAGAPIRVRDQVIGFLNINKRVAGYFDRTHADRLQAFADQAGLAIGNARYFRIMEQAKRDWEATFDAMQDAVALLDRNRRIVRVNQAFATLVKTELWQIVGASCDAVMEGEICSEEICPLEQTMETGRPATCVHAFRGRLFEVQSTPVPGGVGQAEPMASVIYAMRDITERRQAEEEIRRRNRDLTLLNRLIAASAGGQDIESFLQEVCREVALALDVPLAAAALFSDDGAEGSIVAEYLGQDRPSAAGTRVPIQCNAAFQTLLRQRAPLVVDDVQTDPRLGSGRDFEGQRGTVSMLALPLIVEGEVAGALTLGAFEPRPFTASEVDLALRVAEQCSGALARARLEETQRHLTAAVEQAAESIIITDLDAKVVYVNPAFERVSGYERGEVVGQNAGMLKSGKHEKAFYDALWQTISGGKVWQGQFVNKKKDGTYYSEDSTITPVRDQAGQIVNYVAVNHDVTREVQLEEQFRQAQKMEALGRLAGGIAHDFNNLLTVIELSTRLLQRHLHTEDPLWEYVQRIQETGKRASTLTKQLLSFSRREIIEPRLLNMSEVVGDLSRMLKRIIGEDIELVIELGDDLWPVRMDSTQVDQVIFNLVVNARDAMPQGGTLIIQTANAVLDEAYVAQQVDVQAGEYVLLSIADTGAGMNEEVQSHLFEPFFTTKERGQGTGLGLAAVFGIVKQNKGHIRFYSRVGLGTTFKIYLPRASATAADTASRTPPALATSLVSGTETILVVEDEVDVLDLTVRVLEACGYEVLTAGDGPEALTIALEHEDPIDLLLTDVVMPRMYGKELAEELQKQRPKMRLLFMSGYPDRAVMQQNVSVSGVAFLPKPFSVEELTHKVRAVLDDRF